MNDGQGYSNAGATLIVDWGKDLGLRQPHLSVVASVAASEGHVRH